MTLDDDLEALAAMWATALYGNREPMAWHEMYAMTLPDGRVQVRNVTNDDNDDGWPDGVVTRWTSTYDDRETMLRVCGRSRHGVSGVVVRVFLDGDEIT
jgi:hypothetical protein